MNQLSMTEAFPGSRLQYAESNDEFVLNILPALARARYIAIPVVVGVLVAVAFGIFAVIKILEAGMGFSWDILVFASVVGLAILFAILFLGFLFWGLVGGELSTTVVYIKDGQMSVRTRMWGRERKEIYPLGKRSFVKQWWGSLYHQGHGPADVTERPGGLVVSSDGEKPDKLCYDFGGSLNPRELDWVEDRINQFLRNTESGRDSVHGPGQNNPSR